MKNLKIMLASQSASKHTRLSYRQDHDVKRNVTVGTAAAGQGQRTVTGDEGGEK